ncbi:hypothetical protein VI03_12485 [Burkholderia vietnamiensis]|nr:hypothetical protein VI03_12485 [Burkholderia vietnamiensis]
MVQRPLRNAAASHDSAFVRSDRLRDGAVRGSGRAPMLAAPHTLGVTRDGIGTATLDSVRGQR